MNRRVSGAAALVLLAFALAAPALGDEPLVGPDSGLPVPRYVALKTDRANARRGPGVEHQIDWIYQRAGLPLLVTAESGPWRRVRDPDEAAAWIHSGQLENRRTVYVRGGRLGSTALRRRPQADARILAYLARGVVARLEACRGAWRLVTVEGRTGWADASTLWGAESCGDAAPDHQTRR